MGYNKCLCSLSSLLAIHKFCSLFTSFACFACYSQVFWFVISNKEWPGAMEWASLSAERKWPWSFCQKSRWQVIPKHAYAFYPTKSLSMLSRLREGTYQGNELTRNSSGKLVHSRLTWLSRCGLVLAWKVELARANWLPLKKKNQKAQSKKESSNFPPQILACEANATSPQ